MTLRLRDHVWKSIEQKIPIAFETRDFIQEITKRLLDLPTPTFVEWVTRSGFPVSNRYLKSKHDRVVLPFLGEKVTVADEYTNEARRKKCINSVVANFTHSQDACHLVLSVNAAKEEGIQALTVHDCYATTAPDTERFAQIRRWGFATMYLFDDPLARLRDLLPPGTNDLPPPQMGDLDLLIVGHSKYLDRP